MPNRIRPGARQHPLVTDDDLWEALGKAARQQGTDRAKVLNAAAARYVKRHLPREQWPASIPFREAHTNPLTGVRTPARLET